MRDPIGRYAHWLIEKSLDIEMRGGTWNYVKAFSLMMAGSVGLVLPITFVFSLVLNLLGIYK